jgi:hypothetical protein
MANMRTEIRMQELESFPDYHISDDGIVYTTKKSPRYNPKGDLKVLKPRNHPSGYLYVGMFVGSGKTKVRVWRRVHRLVAETYIGELPKHMDVDHIDGDKHNNDYENLRIITHQQNCVYAGARRKNKKNEKN